VGQEGESSLPPRPLPSSAHSVVRSSGRCSSGTRCERSLLCWSQGGSQRLF
jgi:hypothetical protein